MTEKELEYLFKMIDTNKDGLIDLESELALYTPQREQKYFLPPDLNYAKAPKSASIPDIAWKVEKYQWKIAFNIKII